MSYETQPAIASDSEFDFEKLLTEIRKLVAWRCPIHTERRIKTPSDIYEAVWLIIDALDKHLFRLQSDNQAREENAEETENRLKAEILKLRRELADARDIPCG